MKNLFEIENRININDFSQVFTPDVKTTIETIRKYGFDLRVVGGAVRDFLLGNKPRDVDFATDAEPAELIFIFDLEGIDYDAGGIGHGTVKAVFGDDKVDVTSITYKMKVTDNHIKIARNNSWERDSASRDITINSMSLDLQGNLYDYQNGESDLAESLVKFCPDPQTKIDQDPIIILRWFKAVSLFQNPKWLQRDQLLIQRNASKVGLIRDDDRTKLLLSNLLTAKNSQKIFKLMCDLSVAEQLDITCN